MADPMADSRSTEVGARDQKIDTNLRAANVRAFAAEHALWTAATRVVAAVSGGSDSVGMLFLLHDLHARGELRLATIAHLNHQIRPEAEADERFCHSLAERLGVPFVSRQVDVPALARQRRVSLEVAGRVVRRQFLLELKRQLAADAVATGHTRDDQAETLLLRLVRGTGVRGMAGIRPKRAGFIRPVLCLNREDLEAELRSRGEVWRVDETNADLSNPRNRVRHELLPYLAQHFNPAVRDALARLAELAREDEDLLARQSAAAAVCALRHDDNRVVIDADAVARLAPALARRVVSHALRSVSPSAPAARLHVDAVIAATRRPRGRLRVPGVRVEHSGKSVVLVPEGHGDGGVAPFEADLMVPGAVEWSDAGVVVEAYAGDASHAGNRPDEIAVAADALRLPLRVRNRRPGDRLRPCGLGGHKKVQDIFTDRKVPRAERDRIPIVTDLNGRIVWVAGHAMSEEYRVTDGTNGVIILKLRRI